MSNLYLSNTLVPSTPRNGRNAIYNFGNISINTGNGGTSVNNVYSAGTHIRICNNVICLSDHYTDVTVPTIYYNKTQINSYTGRTATCINSISASNYNNGIRKLDNNVGLGGALTGNTIIQQCNHSFCLNSNDGSDMLSSFKLAPGQFQLSVYDTDPESQTTFESDGSVVWLAKSDNQITITQDEIILGTNGLDALTVGMTGNVIIENDLQVNGDIIGWSGGSNQFTTITKFNNFTGSTLPANYYNKVQINSYSGNTNTTINTKADKTATINTVTGTSYTIQSSDNSKIIELTNTNTITLTLTTGLTTGFQATIVKIGSGTNAITLTKGTGVSLIYSVDNYVKITKQYAAATVYYRGSNIWVAFGALVS
jgi:hypothetical protein